MLVQNILSNLRRQCGRAKTWAQQEWVSGPAVCLVARHAIHVTGQLWGPFASRAPIGCLAACRWRQTNRVHVWRGGHSLEPRLGSPSINERVDWKGADRTWLRWARCILTRPISLTRIPLPGHCSFLKFASLVVERSNYEYDWCDSRSSRFFG